MEYKSDIEIAQSANMRPIAEVAQSCGIDLDLIENYGKYKAKIDYAPLLKKEERGANSCSLRRLRRLLRARAKPRPP